MGTPSDLTRLLETEARLEERLRRTRDETARLVDEARAAAQAREAALDAEIEEAARRLEAEITEERRRRELEIAEAARREVQRFEGAPARIADLARCVVNRLIEGAR